MREDAALNAQSVRAVLESEETLREAIATIDRIAAFVDRWRSQYHKRSGPTAARRAIRASKWILDAIGGSILAIPTVNKDEQKRSEECSYLLFLENPLGMQTLRLSATNEALFATLETKLGIIRDGLVMGREAAADEWRQRGYESEDLLDTKTNGLVDHAMQMRMWRETGLVPLVFDDDVARGLAAVMGNRTREDWISADSHDAFWTCTAEEYRNAGSLSDALGAFAPAIGREPEEFLSYTLDWKSPVTVRPDVGDPIAVHATREGAHVRGHIPLLVKDGPLGRIQVGHDHMVVNPDETLPESVIARIRSGVHAPLDDFIRHWALEGRGWQLEGTIPRSRPGAMNTVEIGLRKAAPQVVMLEPPPEQETSNCKLRSSDLLRLRPSSKTSFQNH